MIRPDLNRVLLTAALLLLSACARKELLEERRSEVIYQLEVVNSQNHAMNVSIDKGEGMVLLGQVGAQSSRRFEVPSRTDEVEVLAVPTNGDGEKRREVDLDPDRINRVNL